MIYPFKQRVRAQHSKLGFRDKDVYLSDGVIVEICAK